MIPSDQALEPLDGGTGERVPLPSVVGGVVVLVGQLCAGEIYPAADVSPW